MTTQENTGLSFALSEDQQMLVDTVRRYCQNELRPMVKANGDDLMSSELMRANCKKLTEFGFVSGPLPVEVGGLGLSWVTYGLILEQVAQVSLDVIVPAFVQNLCSVILSKVGSPEIRERYLPRLLSSDLIACVGISEPGVGSNVVEVACKAKPVEGGYLISGEKTWISNGHFSDICICVARTGEAPSALDLFLVERSVSPYETKNLKKIASNAHSTAQLFFSDCFVPECNRLTHNGQGLRQITGMFGFTRQLVGLYGVAIAQAAFDAALSYAKERSQHGKLIAGHQLVSSYLAEMATEIDAARLLCLRGLDLHNRGIRCETEASMAKWYSTEMAVRVTKKAMQIHGANGLTPEYPVENLVRIAHIFTIPEGTTEINKLIIGRALTGISAF